MRFETLQRKGREMATEEVAASIRGLSADARFAAIVALVERNIEDFSAAASSQALADSPGKLTHCAGSSHGLRVLLGQLAHAIEPTAARGGQEKPEEA